MAKIKENQNIFDLIPDLNKIYQFLSDNKLPLNIELNPGTPYIGKDTIFANSYINSGSPWILATGLWRDFGIWIDSEIWKDN